MAVNNSRRFQDQTNISSVWILTREINQYDQDGEYFVDVFKTKPTANQLIASGVDSNRVQHVLTEGGGRIQNDGEWFHLREKQV